MVDPIVSGLGRQGAEMFKEATKQLENSSQQVSKFEELRARMETEEMAGPKKVGGESMKIQQSSETLSPQAPDQVSATNQAQKVGDIPKVTDMVSLEKVVDRLKAGQSRLQELVSSATSGKTFSPQEMIALQAEVQQITTEIQLCSKIVEQGVSSIKSTMQMQV
jgi:hypothetical protein